MSDPDPCRPDQSTLCCPPIGLRSLSEEEALRLSSRLKALADPVRVRLMSLLASTPSGELCACDLPELVGRSQPTISHHLKLLTEAGLVAREQRGRWAWFRLLPGPLDELRAALDPTTPGPGLNTVGAVT